MRVANAALQESEARYRASFERSPVPMHTVDGAARITAVSDSWLSLLGYRREEVIGRPIADFQPPGCARSQVSFQDLVTLGEMNELERRFIRRDGSVVEALVSARTERWQDATWAVCAVTDITARRRAEEALRASEERLHQAQKMEAVGQLTGGIAHDFNNMLQGISGALDLLERRIAEGRPETANAYIAAIRQSAERAAALTHRLLAFARRQALQPQPVEPNAVVLGIEELIKRSIGPAIALRLCLGETVWPALCDPIQLESAIVNLAINARDAMPEGGNLTITTAEYRLTGAEQDATVDAKPGDYVEVAVTDDGEGMPPHIAAHVFEPFFTTKPAGQGSGLGLSQLYGFVQQSGGFVRLETADGEGTTVRLYLPRHHAAVAASPDKTDPAPRAVLPPLGGTALVVDDEAVVCELIAASLEDLGMSVLQAADATAALGLLQSSKRIDLLVTDVVLPGLNGRLLAEAARERRPGLPVVLISGFAGNMLDDLPIGQGVEVLGKPFALDTLGEKVRAVMSASVN